MRWLALPLLLGLAHGVTDGVVGWLLGSLIQTLPLPQVGLMILLYNFLAFAGQPVAGLLVDRLKRPRTAVLVALLLTSAVLLVGRADPISAVALAGLGSALFHVGGGALALGATPGRAAGPGIFAAPGVLGLAVGGVLASNRTTIIWPVLLLLLLLIISIVILSLSQPDLLDHQHRADTPHFTGHDVIMLMLLGAIASRSLIWSSLQFVFQAQGELIVQMAVAAALGKLAGGVLADRLGWRCWVMGTLALAAPLLVVGEGYPALFLAGVALLQSVTPVTLAAMGRLLPRAPAMAAGLTLGFGVALGGIPVAVGTGAMIITPPGILLIILVALPLLFWSLQRAETVERSYASSP